MQYVAISNETRPLIQPLIAKYCSSFFCRLRGLTFRNSLPVENGLMLVENTDSRLQTAIHMLFVFMDLGIIWINQAGEVVDARLAKPWISFIIPARAAMYVLEVSPQRLKEFRIGDQIHFEETRLP
jgi:uncharacterized membrane protein (UPF0127 family)